MNDEMAELKIQLSNARNALYFAKRDHEREVQMMQRLKANDEAFIEDLKVIIRELKG